MEITISQNENQTIGISNRNAQDILVNDNDIQTLRVESNTPQTLGINQNENQVILIGGGGEVIGITDVLVNGVSVVSGNIAYVIVPTKTSELQNNSGFITSETDPTVPSYVKAISLADINKWNSKQDQLVSGTNIKTINNTSLLGSGNIDISGGETYTAGTGIEINNGVINNTITNYNDLTDLPTIPNKTSDLINDEDFVSEDDLSEVAFTGSYNSLSDTPIIPDSTSDLINDSDFITGAEVSTELATKQDTLVSGTNIKTINNNSLLGSGNIALNIPTKTSDLTNDSNFVTSSEVSTEIQTAVSSKQDTLVSGTNIKTINNNSLLGSGNIQIEQTYSTTETKIGKWTDGRDLYRKVIPWTFLNTNQWNNIEHHISYYEIVNLIATMYYPANANFYSIPNDVVPEIRIDTTYFGYYFTNSNFSYSATGHVVIEYTK